MQRPTSKTPSDSPPRSDQRIAKLLARAGVASRREIERMIADGRVARNGIVIDTPATVLASLDGVTVDGAPVEAPAPARLFLYHKPPGLLVTEHDPAGRPTIYDRLPKTLPRVMPVGRLDLATEGLLLLTTDGELKRQLELPATGVQRAYRARAYGPITQEQLEELIHGIEIEGVRYGSIDANLERRTGANVWIEMILTEGKNREVRRVLDYLGLKVSRLIRTRYGPFVLGDLAPGAVGEVRGHDVASFRKNPTRLDLPQPARSRSPEPVYDAVKPAPRARGEGMGERRGASAAPKTRGAVAPRITREAAAKADRASFADVRAPRKPGARSASAASQPRDASKPAPRRAATTSPRESTWSPRDSRPADGPAASPAPVKPKRFYDAKPKAGTTPARGEGTSRARRTATDPRPKRDRAPGERPTPPRGPARPSKPRPPRTRK
ncbi:pseudouridine synthase [Sphingomonas sp. H39-1-10]|uniref:pseudouridine synthase n=1 Tax=Sphingomonas pollutisoli TaxID=3030829 RepID=UPI0023B9FFB8|nr:pseudouridine synthase [Sphingomonas pollutisoli]MDF0489513.1 pseudouridine synthase [Sphingomonas pollutisoli]